jgi:pimeloyl-ACP methyl ester carboxylesterase
VTNRKRNLIGGAVAVAAGAAVVGARRLVAERRIGVAEQDLYVPPEADRHGFLRASDGISLYYEQDGPRDAPLTVVFVHGFCLNRDDFLFQRKAMREQFAGRVRLISYDQRSHGKSERCAAEHASIDQLGADLQVLLDALAPTGRLVLVGHSMGGMSILALAEAHPELFGPEGRVSGVLLISTSTGKLATVTLGLPAALAKLRGPVLPVLLRGASRRPNLVERGRARTSDLSWLYLKRFAFGSDVDPGLVEFLSNLIAQTRIDVIADFYATLMDHDKLAALDTLRDTPVTVVCGDRDLLTPIDHSRTIADALPHSKLVVVHRAGHQVLMERPDEVNPALAGLVERGLGDALAEALAEMNRRPGRQAS